MTRRAEPSDFDRIERALARLRPAERQVLLLSAAEGLSYAAIAARLGISPGKAERLLAKALERLDRAFERDSAPGRR